MTIPKSTSNVETFSTKSPGRSPPSIGMILKRDGTNWPEFAYKTQILMTHLEIWDCAKPTNTALGLVMLTMAVDNSLSIMLSEKKLLSAVRVWDFLETLLNNSTFSSAPKTLYNLTNFTFGKLSNIRSDLDTMVRLGENLKRIFGDRIEIDTLVTLSQLANLPAPFQKMQADLETDRLDVDGLEKLNISLYDRIIRAGGVFAQSAGKAESKINADKVFTVYQNKPTKCSHFWNSERCWHNDCHPELKPNCECCKRTDKKHWHKHKSEKCQCGNMDCSVA